MSEWKNTTKNITSWVSKIKDTIQDFLLKEDLFFLLLETGDKIIIRDSQYTTKTKNSSSWASPVKN